MNPDDLRLYAAIEQLDRAADQPEQTAELYRILSRLES